MTSEQQQQQQQHDGRGSNAETRFPPDENSGAATTATFTAATRDPAEASNSITDPISASSAILTTISDSISSANEGGLLSTSSPLPGGAPALAPAPLRESSNSTRRHASDQPESTTSHTRPSASAGRTGGNRSGSGTRRGSRSGISAGAPSDGRRRHSFSDSLTPRSSYPFSQLSVRDPLLEPLDEEPSRDPRDTSAATPATRGGSENYGEFSAYGEPDVGALSLAERTETAVSTSETQQQYQQQQQFQASAQAGPAVVDFDGLSWPSTGTRRRLDASEEEKAARKERLAGAVRTILECVGEDVQREGLLKTPHRYAEALMFFTNGYEQNLRDIVNGAIFNEDHNEMVIVRDIEVMSMCEHHLVPFMGRMYIGYIPANRVLGLSKFARIADMFSRRLQVQERLTKQVAAAINDVLRPQGVAVVVESSHLCMVMRGVQQTQSTTTTSCMLGAFERRDRTRQEFLSLALRR